VITCFLIRLKSFSGLMFLFLEFWSYEGSTNYLLMRKTEPALFI
jgi:hypothetical protein